MKATRQSNKFEPVCLLLETQEEVNAIFVLMNHLSIANGLNLQQSEILDPFITPEYKLVHEKLCKLLK